MYDEMRRATNSETKIKVTTLGRFIVINKRNSPTCSRVHQT